MSEKRRLLGMTLDELKGVASEVGLPGYAAKQMADWLYKKKVTSIASMTNIAAAKRALLQESFEVGAVPPCDLMKSVDGTIKYLYPAVPVILSNPCISRRKTEQRCVFLPRWDVK